MTTDSNQSTNTTNGKPDVEELQANIEQTRQELGETVDALSAKLDVKSRTKARLTDTKQRAAVKLNDTKGQASVKLNETKVKASQLTASAKQSATDETGKPKPAVLGGAAGVAAAVVGVITLVLVRKNRR